MPYKIAIENIYGTSSSKTVHHRDQIQRATLDLVEKVPFLAPGDHISIMEVDELGRLKHWGRIRGTF